MSEGGGSSSWHWAVVGSTAAIAVAGISYLAYSWWSDASAETEEDPMAAAAAATKLRVAKGLQMQTLAAAGSLPRRKTPATSAASSARPALNAKEGKKSPAGLSGPKASVAPAPASSNGGEAKAAAAGASASASNNASNRKVCANCGKPTSGLPLRCSGCKQAYYCSQDCQKKAWPEHKLSCKAASSSGGSGGGSGSSTTTTPKPSGRASSEAPSASTAGTSAAASADKGESSEASSSSCSAAAGGAKKEEPKSFSEALAMYLQENAASKADQLEANFEMAVMMFVKGEYRESITLLERVQSMAREKSNTGMEGEVYKWLGHAHNKLSDTAKAEKLFQSGVDFARKHDLPRLEIDCLGGLGVMLRGANKPQQSVEVLEQALALCEKLGDEDSKASTLCNLGSALMQIDPTRALNLLHEAVTIREQALERLAEAGQRDGLATAVMEHASALVNLASALFATKRFAQAKVCYEKALEVFELVEDVDKVAKVLVNLANMSELHVSSTQARKDAAEYRTRLLSFLENHGVRRLDTECAICLEPMNVKETTTDSDKEIIMLACLHCLHNKCWEKHMEAQGGDVSCPTCRAPIPLVQ